MLVCQHGGRHRYAIPRMLEQAEMLAALYTDTSQYSPIGRVMDALGSHAPGGWAGSARSVLTGVSRNKVYSSDRQYAVEGLQRAFGKTKSGAELYLQRHRLLSEKMISWGTQGASAVYSMYHENLDFIRYAKAKGLASIVDVFISPLTDRIMAAEAREFPQWGNPPDPGHVALDEGLWAQTAELADLLICPSEWVASGVRTVSPEADGKIAVVPYGCSMNYAGEKNRPVKGRVLFAGRDPLRKGLQYLARAADQLKSQDSMLDFRVAGQMPEEITALPECSGLNFLGQLDRESMRQEFLSADMLVLPALSEGFAGVVAEAIGAGCPVIVTAEAGSPVVHEREGLIVQSRSSTALADAVLRMTQDRVLREKCAAGCLEQIPFYKEEAWRNRLILSIKGVLP